ncbi:hypothetical protein IEQ34_004799 [Dendrobium chrysotoxum]|uniref:Uncharacterized protein n=1 Tax=Dendrobium chrysotoxum TaxID=161865 RepID=A0AAV7H714_DENCH|nr:hypothetical protein IEQ34_004799 [Dendrobium chrysotoxum]
MNSSSSSAGFVVASILETDIDNVKWSNLRWVGAKINKQRKNMKEMTSNQSDIVDQGNKTNSNEETNVGAVGSAVVEIDQYDKCGMVLNSRKALGGHKCAHYTTHTLSRPGSNARLQARVAAVVTAAAAVEAVVVIRDFDLNEPVEELFLFNSNGSFCVCVYVK